MLESAEDVFVDVFPVAVDETAEDVVELEAAAEANRIDGAGA